MCVLCKELCLLLQCQVVRRKNACASESIVGDRHPPPTKPQALMKLQPTPDTKPRSYTCACVFGCHVQILCFKRDDTAKNMDVITSASWRLQVPPAWQQPATKVAS